MISPITQKENVILEKEISSSYVIERYKKELDIDVSRFFKNLNSISIYKCLDTGYRFYYPFNIAGDDSFYQNVEKFPWYYMDWKWEHSVAEKLIKKSDQVLEIGCARGSFLEKIKENRSVAEGLEMNSDALKECLKKGLNVSSDPIEKFSLHKNSVYDVVCSFQVVEHIADIKAFIDSSLTVLKPGGRMIIAVPNNDCLMFEGENIILNMPPHHMGMWNTNSLIQLQNYFNMKIDSVHLEPLQEYHVGFAHKLAAEKINKKLEQKLGFLTPLFKKLANRLAFLGISGVSEHIIGHSILVVFKKNE